jgi:cytochrome o ubiquinol oxidase subunit 2
VLMLLIIIPVMALTVWFAWKYRESNKQAEYEPDWHHSTRLELVIWAAPLLIIICLGALTWLGTHLLDPYRPLVHEKKPLEVQVVALDWKWLFIYPEYGIATLNQLSIPVDRPISMHITASSVMNSIYIPDLAGQVYAMPSMETRLHGVSGKIGKTEGFSANYSGAGFSGMRFGVNNVSDADFDKWVQDTRGGERNLTREDYQQLSKPSENEPARSYARVDDKLYHDILNRCVEPGTMCMDHVMTHEHEH